MKKRNLSFQTTSEAIMTSRLRLSVRLVIERILSDPQRAESHFNQLGYILIKMNEVDDACTAFEQRIKERDHVWHYLVCDLCRTEAMVGKRFVCKTCAAMDLCNDCMSKYKEGASVRGCIGHEFLEIPRPECENFAPEAVNKEDETIQQWTERIFKTYQDAVMSSEEACAIGYEGRPKNLRIGANPSSQKDAQLEPIPENDSQSGPPTSPNTNVEVVRGNDIKNPNPGLGADSAENKTQLLLLESEVAREDAGRSTSEDINHAESTNVALIPITSRTTDTTVATFSGPNSENSVP